MKNSLLSNTEETMPKKKVKEEEYVTRGEFEEAMMIVNKSFNHVATKKQVQKLSTQVNSRINDVEETQKTILEIVKSVDTNVKELKTTMADIPERVTKLEKDVFQLKLQQNRR